MRPLFSKSELQQVSSALAFVLLLTSVPLTAGIVVVSGASQPGFTINICQPLQAFDRVSNTLLARPATSAPQFMLMLLTPLEPRPEVQAVERSVPPDTPPPKRFV